MPIILLIEATGSLGGRGGADQIHTWNRWQGGMSGGLWLLLLAMWEAQTYKRVPKRSAPEKESCDTAGTRGAIPEKKGPTGILAIPKEEQRPRRTAHGNHT